MPSPSTPLLQGTLDLIVLQLLDAAPTNGYDLALRIQATTSDVLNVNAGSLYPALYRLEQRGLIRATWDQTDNGRHAKVYSTTRSGRKHLAEQRESWRRFSGALTAILRVT
jgi:transcriptional regulator